MNVYGGPSTEGPPVCISKGRERISIFRGRKQKENPLCRESCRFAYNRVVVFWWG